MWPDRLSGACLVGAALFAALFAAGCGNERRQGLPVAPDPSPAKVVQRFPGAGLRLELPENVTVRKTARPGVFYGSFGETVISVFAYRRRESLPSTDAQLNRALERLERATQDRDPAFKLRNSKTSEVNGSRATELVGDQTLQNKDLRTHSVHVYKGKAEYVLELLAPRRDFTRFDRDLFDPVLDSLEVTGKVDP